MIKLPASVQRINLTYYTLIVVVLGVPLWWYTTDTYRATLPHSQIEPLADAKILIEIPVVVCFNPHGVYWVSAVIGFQTLNSNCYSAYIANIYKYINYKQPFKQFVNSL